MECGDDCARTWMLNSFMFGPLRKRVDGTYVFATPIQAGQVPMIALADLGFFARYSFDNRARVSGKELEVTSELVGWDHLVATFTRVTGKKAVVLNQSLDEWVENFTNVDMPVANEEGAGTTTWKQNFSSFWRLWRDGIITRDMDWIQSVNPKGHTLEGWMRETGYTGDFSPGLLKNNEDGKSVGIDWERVRKL